MAEAGVLLATEGCQPSKDEHEMADGDATALGQT
jgi:hypothetical protein